MERERGLLLRRTSPLAAVLVLLAPAAGHASSFSPDPPPGAHGLRPDPAPAPTAAAVALPVHAAVRTAPSAPVRTVTAPAPARVVPRARPRRPVVRSRPPKVRPAASTRFELPPVLVPAFIAAPLQRRPRAYLAALALALAALTAGSGAGLVRAWSRR